MTLSLLLVLFVSVLGAASGKIVHVSLKADFGSGSLLHQSAEFYGEVESSYFWRFVAWSTSSACPSRTATAAELYNAIAANCLTEYDDSMCSALQMSLGLRSYSAKLETIRQLRNISRPSADDCEVLFVYGDGHAGCSFAREELKRSSSNAMSSLFEFDHVKEAAASSSAPGVIVYANLQSASFARVHDELQQLAALGELRYVLRLYDDDQRPFNLHGFGVELAHKNMEYNVLDDTKRSSDADDDGVVHESSEEQSVAGFYFETLKARFPRKQLELDALRDRLRAAEALEIDERDEMHVWELSDLGLQAVQYVVNAADPLRRLVQLSSDFPSRASRLKRLRLDANVSDALNRQRNRIVAGKNKLLLNGIEVDLRELDVYALQSTFTSETRVLRRLHSLRLAPDAIARLLRVRSVLESTDEFRVDTRGDALSFLNNVEKDAMYKTWSRDFTSMLSPAWPNEVRIIRRNIYVVVAVVDAASLPGLALIAHLNDLIAMKAPVRVGVVFSFDADKTDVISEAFEVLNEQPGWTEFAANLRSTNDVSDISSSSSSSSSSLSVLVARLFRILFTKRSAKRALAFLTKLHAIVKRAGTKRVERSHVFEAFVAQCKKRAMCEGAFTKASNGVETHRQQEFIDACKAYTTAKALGSMNELLLNGAALKPVVPFDAIDAHAFQQLMIGSILPWQKRVQQDLIDGVLHADTSLASYIFEGPAVFPALDARIVVPRSSLVYRALSPDRLRDIVYVPNTKTTKAPTTFSYWMVGSLRFCGPARSALSLLQHVRSSPDARLAFLSSSVSRLDAIVMALQADNDDNDDDVEAVLQSLERVVCLAQALACSSSSAEASDALLDAGLAVLQSYDARVKAAMATKPKTEATEAQARVVGALGLHEHAVLLNGRLLELGRDEKHLTPAAVALLELVERRRLLQQVADVFAVYPSATSDVLLSASVLVAQRNQHQDISPLDLSDLDDLHCVLLYPTKSHFNVLAVVDPLSVEAQRLAPTLLQLRDALGCSLKVYLNPHKEMSELQLKRFYRFVFEPQLHFNSDGSVRESAVAAVFRNSLPVQHVLTMGIDVHESWLVEATKATLDLDNLRLDELRTSTLRVEYGLSSILVAGSCIDDANDQPAAGLKLALSSITAAAHTVDTIVMSNLGYFQLKASAGVWKLRAASGRSSRVYEPLPFTEQPHRHEFAAPLDGDADGAGHALSVLVTSLVQRQRTLRVRRLPGSETLSLLDHDDDGDDDAAGGLWNRWFGASPPPTPTSTPTTTTMTTAIDNVNTVHVFSLASGHLYERFLRIMMLSVKRTLRAGMKVKFWFVRQFLSPTFKRSVLDMAAKYAFEVELVSYKWPSWLRRQTEKQRIIWGYKILFLDVLFPLGLHRIIFIDADQVVRSDVAQLWKMDLRGHSYAYTPFCDSNAATEGFRFWKKGFWKDHLRNKPYHISALYVVDLREFRRRQAGDTLRAIYDNLSRDPNSLANLDQDLPNYAQHIVPILSLPQEWLWCETWCSMESLSTARTIDLCNNPMTKEPKLDRAKRLVKEWDELDREANEAPDDASPSSPEPEEVPETHDEL